MQVRIFRFKRTFKMLLFSKNVGASCYSLCNKIEIVSKNLTQEQDIPHSYPMKKFENFNCFYYEFMLQALKSTILK